MDTTQDLDYWLKAMPSAGFRYIYWPNSAEPECVGGLRRWRSGFADVLIIRDSHIATAYRAVRRPRQRSSLACCSGQSKVTPGSRLDSGRAVL